MLITTSFRANEQTIETAINKTLEAINERHATLIVSSLISDILAFNSDFIFRDIEIPESHGSIENIKYEIFQELQETELRKIDFKVSPGVTGLNRSWAEDLTVYGPEPERKELITYHIKISHSSPLSVEVDRSMIASQLLLGPIVVYGHKEKGIIVEEWLEKGNIRERAPELTGEEKQLAGHRLAEKFYCMFDMRREVRVTHKFDNLPFHIFIIGSGKNITIRFIDWGKDCVVHKKDRQYFLEEHLKSLIEQIRQHLDAETTAYFVSTLMKIAEKTSAHELEFFNTAYQNAREALVSDNYFKDRNQKFFEEVDKYLEDETSVLSVTFEKN